MNRFRRVVELRWTVTPNSEIPSALPRSEALSEADIEVRHDERHPLAELAYPTGERSDRSKFVRFARSAAKLADLRRTGALVPVESTEAVAVLVDERLIVPPADSVAELDARKRLWEATQTLFELPIVVGSESGTLTVIRGHLDARAVIESSRAPVYLPVLRFEVAPTDPPRGPMVSKVDNL